MFLCNLKVYFRLNSDAIVPPFTSKVSKTLLIKLTSSRIGLSIRERGFKPIVVTPVFLRDRPIYSVKGKEAGLLSLKAGQEYWFRIAMVGTVAEDIIPEMVGSCEIKLFNTKVYVTKIDVEVKAFSNISLNDCSLVRVEFVTPTILRLSNYPKLRIGSRHILFPVPSLMIKSLVIHWNSYAGPEDMIKNTHSLCFLSDYFMVEVDHRIKPVTAIYDEKRRPRGFVGWVIYKLRRGKRRRKTFKNILKLLDYASYVGIGVSRSTGFGVVNVKTMG